MTTFNGGILDIPGLVPVNIGSSNPYPVPFAPQIKPPQSAPFNAVGSPTGQGQGAGPGFGTNEGGSSYSGVDQYTPTFGSTTADPSFVDFPGSGGSGGYGSYSNYSPQIMPAQSHSFDPLGALSLFSPSQPQFQVPNNGGANTRDYVNAALNGIGMIPGMGAVSAINNGARGLESGFDRAAYGDVEGPNPTIFGSQAAGNMAYGKGAIGTLTDGLGWLGGQLSNLFGFTPGDIAPNTYGPMDALVPPDFSGPSNDVYSGVPNYTAQSLAGYGSGAYDPNNPWGYDPQAAAANAALSHTKLGDVGGSGNGTADGMPADPFSMQGNFLNSFMMGAGFGGAGFDYGDMGLGSSSNPLTEGGWSSPGFGAVDRHANPNDTN